jgi:tRNA modification GTPase
MKHDTIAAISTPYGESGIGVVRISGPLARVIARKIFRAKKEPFSFITHHLHYGEIIDPEKGLLLDEVLIVWMKPPSTYTKEDIVEIQCHGGYLILGKVLELVIGQGARMAEPGEFTKRAFLNGRIDLTRAEAVIDLIKAKTEAGLQIANQQIRGALSKELLVLKETLIDHLALVEAHIDFPDEEIDPVPVGEMKEDLNSIVRSLDEWIGSYEEGRLFKEGVRCAIAGKTNAGKSSLLNVLLKEERAIVTPVPGTTRDVIEEVFSIRGIPVRLMDTAGMRTTTDLVEGEGVRRTKEKVAEADLVLLVLDGSRELDENDDEILKELGEKKKVVAVNKMDLPLKWKLLDIEGRLPNDPKVPISALNNKGIEDLKEAIYSSLINREITISAEHLVVTNLRHKAALSSTREALLNSLALLEDWSSLELVAFEIRSALDAIGEVVGETATEDVLSRIFDQFCIGK